MELSSSDIVCAVEGYIQLLMSRAKIEIVFIICAHTILKKKAGHYFLIISRQLKFPFTFQLQIPPHIIRILGILLGSAF